MDCDHLVLLRTLDNPAGMPLWRNSSPEDVYPSLAFLSGHFWTEDWKILVSGMAKLTDGPGAMEQETGIRPQELLRAESGAGPALTGDCSALGTSWALAS